MLKTRKFCSVPCQRKGRITSGITLHDRKCENCSVNFKTQDPRDRNCSKKCAAASTVRSRGFWGSSKTTEWASWQSMKGRCTNKRLKEYRRYGGRGISVCDRWKESFENFLEDMGQKPSPTHSLDRINNNGNYEPGNCRWATPKEQSNNTRKCIVIKFNNKNYSSLAELCTSIGIKDKSSYKYAWKIFKKTNDIYETIERTLNGSLRRRNSRTA